MNSYKETCAPKLALGNYNTISKPVFVLYILNAASTLGPSPTTFSSWSDPSRILRADKISGYP